MWLQSSQNQRITSRDPLTPAAPTVISLSTSAGEPGTESARANDRPAAASVLSDKQKSYSACSGVDTKNRRCNLRPSGSRNPVCNRNHTAAPKKQAMAAGEHAPIRTTPSTPSAGSVGTRADAFRCTCSGVSSGAAATSSTEFCGGA